jgi:lysozyme family protein
MSVFDRAFAVVIGHEGGFDANRQDPGNWTGGAVGAGEVSGTNWGIASAAYADEQRALPEAIRATMPAQVRDLTLDQARALYRAAYWDRVSGDALPPPLALLVFDAAVNNGVSRAVIWLQGAVGTNPDGQLGPVTLAALSVSATKSGGAALCAEFQAQRLAFMAGLATWRIFGLGWARRLCALPYQSLTMGDP